MTKGEVRLEPGTPRFAMVPLWLIDTATPRALQCYTVLLGFYADKDTGMCFPSRKTIATRMRCSDGTVDNALVELKTLGAVRIEEQVHASGAQGSNIYWVAFNEPDKDDSASWDAPWQSVANPLSTPLPTPLAASCEPVTRSNYPESITQKNTDTQEASPQVRRPSPGKNKTFLWATPEELSAMREKYISRIPDYDVQLDACRNHKNFGDNKTEKGTIDYWMHRHLNEFSSKSNERTSSRSATKPPSQPTAKPSPFSNIRVETIGL